MIFTQTRITAHQALFGLIITLALPAALLSGCAPLPGADDSKDEVLDADGDGSPADEDCDDSDAAVNPAATEVCDGVDNDCDGYGDGDAEVYPGAEELCDDGIANGCDEAASMEECGFGGSLSLSSLKIVGEVGADQSGYSLSGAGDVDGDGRDDLLIGAFGDDSAAWEAGAAYLLLGGGALAGASGTLTLPDTFRFTGGAAADKAGAPVSGAGDVNGDGLRDLLMGAPDESTNGWLAGASYLYYGGGY